MQPADHQHAVDCLRFAAEDSVSYELRMMGAMACPMTDGRQESRLAGTALLEGYLTHVRCLHEFLAFKPSPRYPTTVRAVDYFTKPPERDSPFSCLPNDTYESICQKLSHLTCVRVPGHSWAIGGSTAHLAELVFERFDNFLESLAAVGLQERVAWFIPGLRQARSDFDAARRGEFVFGRVGGEFGVPISPRTA